MENQEIYSVAQAAEYFSVTPTTIHNWIRSGTLHATKVSNVWRIHIQDMHTLVEPVRGDVYEPNEIAQAIYSISQGDKHGPGGLEALAMAVSDHPTDSDSLATALANALRDGLGDIAQAIREKE